MRLPIEENNEKLSFYTRFGPVRKDNKIFTRLEFNNPLDHQHVFIIDIDIISTNILDNLENLMGEAIIAVYPHFPDDIVKIMAEGMLYSMEEEIKKYTN